MPVYLVRASCRPQRSKRRPSKVLALPPPLWRSAHAPRRSLDSRDGLRDEPLSHRSMTAVALGSAWTSYATNMCVATSRASRDHRPPDTNEPPSSPQAGVPSPYCITPGASSRRTATYSRYTSKSTVLSMPGLHVDVEAKPGALLHPQGYAPGMCFAFCQRTSPLLAQVTAAFKHRAVSLSPAGALAPSCS